MLKRVLCLILGYSLLTFSIAGPTLANISSYAEDRSLSPTVRKELSCPTCVGKTDSKTMDAIDGLAAVGRTTQIQALFPIQRSIREGTPVNFVSTATGHLAFAINDLELAGLMPVVLQRFYSSERKEDRGLGAGWSFALDDRIAIDGDAATLTSGDGSVSTFRADGGTGNFILAAQQPSLHQSFKVSADTINEEIGGLKRIYKRVGIAYRLTQINDSNGNNLKISFDSKGNIDRIEGSGSRLQFEWSEEAGARLLGVTDNAGRRLSFKHEGRRLRAVIDAAGNEWRYKYSSAGLTTALDPLGRVMLRARYDRTGRVIEAGDAAGAYTYDYDSASSISRRTVVADPLGVKTIYEHNGFGALVALQDDSSQKLLEITYDSANRPTSVLSAGGGESNFGFDEQNRLTRSSSVGSSKVYIYDESGRVVSLTNNGVRTDYARDTRGNIVAAASSEPSQSYRAAYDARGRLLTIESETGGKVTNEYDANGNLTAFSSGTTGRTQIERDATGQIIEKRFPSGLSIRYDRNSRGIVTRRSESNGQSVTFEHDSSGALTGLVRSDNTWIRASRDLAGRIVALNSSAGKSRRFAYDSRGGLTEYTDATGRHQQFQYDARGRLRGISDDKGNKTTIQRDERGTIQSIVRLSNQSRRYSDNRAGRLVREQLPPGGSNQLKQFVSARYDLSSALPPRGSANLLQFECMFGADGFPSFTQDWTYCWDPYGGFGGSGAASGSGGVWGGCNPLDPYMCISFFGETTEQCNARNRLICQNSRNSCGTVAFTQYLGTMAGCMILMHANPVAGAACVTAAFALYLANMSNCELTYQNCLLAITDRCRR